MCARWSGGNSDISGILRKSNFGQQNAGNSNENRGADLLVFGYACKVFRDDEKALHIDQGKHLISWMGDHTLKIDRYDVRATLSDLSLYEPPPGGYINRLDYLSPAEQKAEQLCEEERYYSLYHNEEEEQMYQEEELKRLHQERSSSYGQVQFDYNKVEENSKNEKAEDSEKSEGNQEGGDFEEPEEIFIAPENLIIPDSIETPPTMKLHAIIEKTAKFISIQGAQMEILIKAKQSNNPQFDFLNQGNRLNPYYKFVLQEFKNGTYPEKVSNQSSENSVDTTNENYYQKSSDVIKNASQFVYPSLPVPILKYRPSANCAYTQLISKIKGVPLPSLDEEIEQSRVVETKPEDETLRPTLLDYGGYYNQRVIVVNDQNTVENVNSKLIASEVQNTQQKMNSGVEVKKISTGLMLAQCYASDTEDEMEESSVGTAKNENPTPKSTASDDSHLIDFPIPPESIKHIIDKTAAYVAKNGPQFEETLRSKKDDRFLFLDADNEYHRYYMYKVTGVLYPYPTSNGILETTKSNTKQKPSGPVSFSIKSKEEPSVPLKPALPQEHSDDESEHNKEKSSTSSFDSIANVALSRQSNITVAGVSQNESNFPHSRIFNQEQSDSQTLTNVKGLFQHKSHQQQQQHLGISSSQLINSTYRPKFDVDSIPSLTTRQTLPDTITIGSLPKHDPIQQKELKRAEEKVKDRLAQIAREKLGLISKEKQLQLERKKKAMAFLTQMKNSGSIPLPMIATSGRKSGENSSSSGTVVFGPHPLHENDKEVKLTSSKIDDNDSEDSDKSSVHSIPIPESQTDENEQEKLNELNYELKIRKNNDNEKGKIDCGDHNNKRRSTRQRSTSSHLNSGSRKRNRKSTSRSTSRSSSRSRNSKLRSSHTKKRSKSKHRHRHRVRCDEDESTTITKSSVDNRIKNRNKKKSRKRSSSRSRSRSRSRSLDGRSITHSHSVRRSYSIASSRYTPSPSPSARSPSSISKRRKRSSSSKSKNKSRD